jgi:hypothetical protein
MTWKPDQDSTRAIRDIFPGHRPEVKINGRHFHLADTPYGQMEIISVGDAYLVAAENPPERMSLKELKLFTPEILAHLRRQVPPLVPWKTVAGDNLQQVLQQLSGSGQGLELALQSLAPFVQTYSSDRPNQLCGESRGAAADTLAGLLAAQRVGHPLPAVTGLPGVGKHTLAADVAGRLGLQPLEIPLRRLLIQRVVQSPAEMVLQVVLAAEERIDGGLAMISEAELLRLLPPAQRRMVLSELAQLPHVVLLVNQPEVPGEDCVPLKCPGLMSREEAGQLLSVVFPKMQVLPQALAMAAAAAADPDVGIIPARLLYVVDLGLSLGRAGDTPARFTPDDAAPAVEIARNTWQARNEDVELL